VPEYGRALLGAKSFRGACEVDAALDDVDTGIVVFAIRGAAVVVSVVVRCGDVGAEFCHFELEAVVFAGGAGHAVGGAFVTLLAALRGEVVEV